MVTEVMLPASILQRKAASPLYSDNLKSHMLLKTSCLDHGNAEPRTNEAWTQLQWADTRLHGGCCDIRGGWRRWPLKAPSHPNHLDSMTFQVTSICSLLLSSTQQTCAGAAAGTYFQLGWILSWQCNQDTVQSQDEGNRQHVKFVTVVINGQLHLLNFNIQHNL